MASLVLLMTSAKSLVTITLFTLLFTVVFPLTAFAATEIHISGSGTASVTVNGVTIEKSADGPDIHINTDDLKTPTVKLENHQNTSAKRIQPPPTSTKTPTPTRTPTPTAMKTPALTPPTGATTTTDTVQTYIINAINDYRKSRGLSPVKTDKHTCAFARIRAQEITKSFDHDGFRHRIVNNALPYPNYRLVTENIAMTSDYKKVVSLWIKSPGHAENMRRDTPYVCVESSGNYYAYEGWKP